jgi:hypothetical protein
MCCYSSREADMKKADERQTQDKRTIERESEDVREEYTTYRETDDGSEGAEEAGARREADLQPSPAREGDSDDAGQGG